MEDRIKELEKENEILRSITESVGAFEKDMHDKSLQVAREIRRRDRKAAANIILNMGFGNRNNVSFCEIFELKENGGCEKHKYCTDCIDAYLKSVYCKYQIIGILLRNGEKVPKNIENQLYKRLDALDAQIFECEMEYKKS